MRRRFFCFLLLCLVICGTIVTVSAAGAEEYNAADVLYDLGLFSGTGAKADGSPNFDLDRAPTRHEAVTMLVSLLGKKEEALAGEWETPFTDVADWAKPYVGYAYANGLTSGTSATTYGGNDLITASQYLTFVLKALGYETGTDFQWDKAWQFSDQLSLTDGRYSATNQTFLRGDVTIVSRNAMDVKMKESKQTLAEKLVDEGLFTKEQYKDSANDPLVLQNQDDMFRHIYFVIDGIRLRDGWEYRCNKGQHIVYPFWQDGSPVTDYDPEIEDIDDGRTLSKVWKNTDGSFTVDLRGDSTAISVYYTTSVETVVDENGVERIVKSRTKTTLSFQDQKSYVGLYGWMMGEPFFDGDGIGDNYRPYWVLDIYLNDQRITGYDISVPATAPFTVTKQADGSMLLTRTGIGFSKFSFTYQGKSVTLEGKMWPM